MDKDAAVRIRDEVVGARLERGDETIVRNRRPLALGIPLLTGRADAHAHDRSGLAVAHEDIAAVIGVAWDEIRREREESDEAPIRGDIGMLAEQVCRLAGARRAHALEGARHAILHEDVRLMISIPDQVARVRLKRHKTAIQADAWVNAGAITGFARCVFSDALDRSRYPVTQVDLEAAGLRSGNEVVSERAEDDKAAIGADIGLNVQAVSRFAGSVDADDLGRSRLTIMYVDLVHEQERVASGHQILSLRLEGNETAIGADSGSLAANICLLSGAVYSDPLGGTQQAVAHEHVGIAVAVSGNEVIGLRHEGDEPAVAR